VSGHFGTSANMCYGQFGTGAEVSWVRIVSGPKYLYTQEYVPPMCLSLRGNSTQLNRELWTQVTDTSKSVCIIAIYYHK